MAANSRRLSILTASEVDAARADLERKAQRVAMLSTQPVYILREALKFLEQQRLVAPGYTFLQDLVGRVVSGEGRRLRSCSSKP